MMKKDGIVRHVLIAVLLACFYVSGYLHKGVVVPTRKAVRFCKERHVIKWTIFILAIFLILLFLPLAMKQLRNSTLFAIYGILVIAYILSRFLLSYLYEEIPENDYEPYVSFVVPAMNEEKAICMTLERIYEVDYPRD